MLYVQSGLTIPIDNHTHERGFTLNKKIVSHTLVSSSSTRVIVQLE